MRSTALAAILFLHLSVHAEGEQKWRWFFSSFCSPSLEATLCTRTGSARVHIYKDRLEATLLDLKIPESPLVFKGEIRKKKSVIGSLHGLGSHEPSQEKFQGAYSALQMGTNCKVEQILLTPRVPDGAVLSLSRVLGTCQ